jgi:hypothetical protein
MCRPGMLFTENVSTENAANGPIDRRIRRGRRGSHDREPSDRFLCSSALLSDTFAQRFASNPSSSSAKATLLIFLLAVRALAPSSTSACSTRRLTLHTSLRRCHRRQSAALKIPAKEMYRISCCTRRWRRIGQAQRHGRWSWCGVHGACLPLAPLLSNSERYLSPFPLYLN